MKKIVNLFLLVSLVFLSTANIPTYDIGDIVSEFTLRNVDGTMVSLSNYKNEKGVIVIFDCNTCPYSRGYNSRIIALHKKYAPLGFPIITINPNDPSRSPGDSFKEMAAQARRKNYAFPYLVDEKQTVARSFGATNTPHVFVLKRESSAFEVAYIGTIDNNSRAASAATKHYVQDAVDALLADQAISTKKTKAIGCGIKWQD